MWKPSLKSKNYFRKTATWPYGEDVTELQGGKMSADKIAAFEQNPFFEPALQLRQWDDQAKAPEKTTPELEHYLSLVKGTLVSSPASQ